MKLIKIIKSNLSTNQKRYLRAMLSLLSPFSFNLGLEKNLNFLKNKINLYFILFPSNKKEFSNEIYFLNNKAEVSRTYSFIFPYSFSFDYDYNHVEVFKDDKKNLFYVIHCNKRLYFSRAYRSEIDIKQNYNSLLIEQDKKSPHRYLNETFNVNENDIVIDIGAADGNFSLEVIDRVKKLYIFESDINWIEALNATFEPWKEKVHIINKFVSNIDDNKQVTLDRLLMNIHIDFIKIDVEGAEGMILEGSKKILQKNNSLKLAICTYHKKNDAKNIEKILAMNKFNFTFSNGYMLFIHSRLTPPYFRRGLIKAQKLNTTEFRIIEEMY